MAFANFGDRHVGSAFQHCAGTHQRVARNVKPQHLLFELQLRARVELEVGYCHLLVKRRLAAIVGTADVAEQGLDAHIAFFAASRHLIDDLLVNRQQTLAGMIQLVEASGLDKRLDASFVEGIEWNPFAEIVKVGERAVGLAFFDDGCDYALAYVSNR